MFQKRPVRRTLTIECMEERQLLTTAAAVVETETIHTERGVIVTGTVSLLLPTESPALAPNEAPEAVEPAPPAQNVDVLVSPPLDGDDRGDDDGDNIVLTTSSTGGRPIG